MCTHSAYNLWFIKKKNILFTLGRRISGQQYLRKKKKKNQIHHLSLPLSRVSIECALFYIFRNTLQKSDRKEKWFYMLGKFDAARPWQRKKLEWIRPRVSIEGWYRKCFTYGCYTVSSGRMIKIKYMKLSILDKFRNMLVIFSGVS